MIEDGRAYGVTIALKHILGLLERKGVFTNAERFQVLDDALEELYGLPLTPTAKAEAGNTVGALYHR